MVMISTLVTAVQEKLNEMADQIKTIREEEKKRKEKEGEAAEKQLFHGTPVTIENSLSWKAKFDVELLEIKNVKIIFRDNFWPFTFCMSVSFPINILMVFPIVCVWKWLKL